MTHSTIAVIVPCRDEGRTIAQVIRAFQAELPDAAIYVYDNCSRDDTAERARAAGAVVRSERRAGKGHVVRRMLADVDADHYVLVDGDATYDAGSVNVMLNALMDGRLDLVNGRRVAAENGATRMSHDVGNRLFTGLVGWLFGREIEDVLSGYKVLSRRFAKSFPVTSRGFEIEAELAIHALTLGVPTGEIDTPYLARPSGSASKLRAVPDGLRILRMIVRLFRDEKPLVFYGGVGIVLAVIATLLAIPLFVEYAKTGLVPRFPTAILCTGIMLSAIAACICGVILESIKRGQRDIKRMLYLQQR